MELKTVYFEEKSEANTEETLHVAKRRADELGIKTVLVASTGGNTGVKAVEILKGLKVVIVTHCYGFHDDNTIELTDENRKAIESGGGIIFTTTHIFSGLSRATRAKYNMPGTGDIIADVLRCFGAGVKVGFEIACMAVDGGYIKAKEEDIITVAGTHDGADTAMVLTPVSTHQFFDIRVKEILCKPHSPPLPEPRP
ncbi:hypothetical protein ACFLXD_01375 [Chloroflexota bacterium]